MTQLLFQKMQATGNDFVMIDNRSGVVDPKHYADLARKVSDRKFGIGSDGLILLEAPLEKTREVLSESAAAIRDEARPARDETAGDTSGSTLVMNYKNPDGSDAGMCGNGARCFVRFAQQLGYEPPIHFRVHEKRYKGEISGHRVLIHFPLETQVQPVTIDGEDLLQIYTNTEHIVCTVPPDQLAKEEQLVKKGRTLRHHSAFAPRGTNVNFIHPGNGNQLHLQTYERGVEDLTLACGTGAIASALALHHLQTGASGRESSEVDQPQEHPSPDGQSNFFTVTVKVSGGLLSVHFEFDASTETYQKIQLEGPAEFVFQGTYPL